MVEFKDAEFKKRFGSLESEIASFYTQINKHDAEHEKIELFSINNSNTEYKIEFKIKDSTIKEDASIKFSEGHLRALGLSILLANAKINSLPFIIFDDVVNAIDSDHRANIIEMMLNDPYLKNAQQIVSTHDRLYWERFSNGHNQLAYVGYILRNSSTGVLAVTYNVGSNSKIEEALKCYDIRQALLYSRIWFETIAKEYCEEKKVTLQGKYIRRQEHLMIEPTISTFYTELIKFLPNNPNLNYLYNNEINFRGLNQEHHSFDEFNYNFIHSKTSREVQNVFEALKNLQIDIDFKNKYESIFIENVKSYVNSINLLNSINPKMKVDEIERRKANHIEKEKNLLNYTALMSSLNFENEIIISYDKKIKLILLETILNMLSKRAEKLII